MLRIPLVVAASVFVLDQLTKWLVVVRMDLFRTGRVEVFPPWFNLQPAWNEGVNFGLLSGFDLRWVLIGVALLISAVVLWWVRRPVATTAERISAGLLVGGALGNVIDRIRWGAVADFLNMSTPWFNNPYSFNVADIAVFIGAAGLVLFTTDGDKLAKKG